MAIELEIRKKAGNQWVHVNLTTSESTTLSSSKQFMTSVDNEVKFKEPFGNIFSSDVLDRIAVYDDTDSGAEETFPSVSELADRLKNLGHPAFYESGDLTIADFVSSDADNALIISPNDGKLFVDSGVNGGTA